MEDLITTLQQFINNIAWNQNLIDTAYLYIAELREGRGVIEADSFISEFFI